MEDHVRRFRDELAEVSRSVKGASADAMRAFGVHIGQNFLLEELWTEDGLTTGELAKRIGVEVPTITRMSQRMESAGLVARVADTKDRRLTRVRLTERGEALRKELPAALDAVAAQGLSRLDRAEREQLVALLGKAAAGFRPTA